MCRCDNVLVFNSALFSSWPGIIHEDLKEFIASNVPASTKKQKVVLGISDTKLSAAVKDELDIECLVSDSVKEIVRGECSQIYFAHFTFNYMRRRKVFHGKCIEFDRRLKSLKWFLCSHFHQRSGVIKRWFWQADWNVVYLEFALFWRNIVYLYWKCFICKINVTNNYIWVCDLSNHHRAWWLSGGFGALRPVGRRFESHSSCHVRTFGKSFTLSSLKWNNMQKLLGRNSFLVCTRLMACVHVHGLGGTLLSGTMVHVTIVLLACNWLQFLFL